MIVLLVAAGAAIGAPARYLVDRAVQTRTGGRFPFGTLVVNVLASLVVGVMAGAAGQVSAGAQALAVTGFCGALSTFSAYGYETCRLVELRARRLAAANVVVSIVVAVAAAALGWVIGQSL